MQLLAKGRRVKISGRMVTVIGDNTLAITVEGPHFPYSSTTPADPNMQFRVVSSEPTDITINYGDGNIVTYNSIGFFSLGYNNRHIYTDSNTGQRVITINIEKPLSVTSLRFRRFALFGAFPNNILKYPNTGELYLQNNNYLTSFPSNLSTLTVLKECLLQSIGTAISQRIPNGLLGLPLETLNILGSVNLSDVYSSNLFSLCDSNTATSLKSLDISNCRLLVLPPNFSNLVSLETLNIGGNDFETVPPEVNDVISLKQLALSYMKPVSKYHTYIGDLINLEYYGIAQTNGSQFDTGLPAGLENCINLTTYAMTGAYTTVQRTNEFVDNMYTFITTNASMVSGNTKFRQLSVLLYRAGYSATPSGTYQQPTGFVLGSSNGTPASPLEKIWVMVNQYQHTWTY